MNNRHSMGNFPIDVNNIKNATILDNYLTINTFKILTIKFLNKI